VHSISALQLFQICASDTGNSEAWSEFLHRYSSKIRYFVNGTLRQLSGSEPIQTQSSSRDVQDDLFQNSIMRLVANNCAAMKRFSGRDENDLLAYLAVISRSAVLDWLRHTHAIKRRHGQTGQRDFEHTLSESPIPVDADEYERQILIGEILSMTRTAIATHSRQTSSRDQLVFSLHFLHGLSFSQISKCRGINLSKAGIEKLLNRVISRVQILARQPKSSETVQ
jgi:RNA polymerase sigma factor (sigma-70 family)